MGWLRDLMRAASPPYKSYGALARDALAHPRWPSDTRTKARSLAAVFSKLDREIDLEWLVDREAVKRVLAELLRCPLADVRPSVHWRSERSAAASRRVRLHVLTYARALELVDEPLCPGFPNEVLEPAKWRSLWWHAPSGSGRSLAGQWLAARGVATFVTARDWEEARDRLPQRGVVFNNQNAHGTGRTG